jgi:hypothetical protein
MNKMQVACIQPLASAESLADLDLRFFALRHVQTPKKSILESYIVELVE